MLSRGRACLVDPDEKDLRFYTEVVHRLGFDVRSFTNYQEAARCLEEESVDFVIVNQGTAAFEARGLVERALARNHHTPVVVLAHCLDMGCYLEAMQLGAVDYVEKPLTLSGLEYLVTTHSEQRMIGMRHSA
jgi:DNA-binding NtrC family response regulator